MKDTNLNDIIEKLVNAGMLLDDVSDFLWNKGERKFEDETNEAKKNIAFCIRELSKLSKEYK